MQQPLVQRPIVECVPNFSEGRDRQKVERIAAAIRGVQGVHLLDIHMDPDHNRSVITFVGGVAGVQEAAVRAVGEAASLIDLSRHRGEHPRIGATDVVPFVPLRGCSLADCVAIAHRVGQEINQRFHIPVYFYDSASGNSAIVRLADVRRGGFERLRQAVLSDPHRRPDIGGPGLHPTAGATVVGARKLLIAFNVNLNSSEKSLAEAIARKVRTSSGGLPSVKAMGVLMQSRNVDGGPGRAQVSMNLTDWEQTSVRQVFEAVESEAARLGVTIHSTEIVGLVPALALEGTTPESLLLEGFGPEKILENRLEQIADETGPSPLRSSG